jgi:hypothetical protein
MLDNNVFDIMLIFDSVILQGGDTLGVAKDRNLLLGDSVVCLSLERVRDVREVFHIFITDTLPLV